MTRIYRMSPSRPEVAAIEAAARALRDGELVVFPTETVYGLAARADDPGALARLRDAKGRDGAKPFTLHLPDIAALTAFFGPLGRAAARLARRRLPGPLTLVLPDRKGPGTTGVRVPDHAVATAVLRAAGVPVAATSVNRSGEPPAVTGSDAAAAAGGIASVVLDAGPAPLGRPSTVVRVDGDRVEVLREGAIPTREVLEDAAFIWLFVCTGNLCRSPLAAALAERDLAQRLDCAPRDLPASGHAVLSAGTAADAGSPASPETVDSARVRGLDLSRHRSRPLTPTLFDRADRVFVMEGAQRRRLLEFFPGAADKVRLLDPAGREIADPYGRGAEVYADVAAALERAVEERVLAEDDGR